MKEAQDFSYPKEHNKEKAKSVEEEAIDNSDVYIESASKIQNVRLEIDLLDSLIKTKFEKIKELEGLIADNHINENEDGSSLAKDRELKLEKEKLEKELATIIKRSDNLKHTKYGLIKNN